MERTSYWLFRLLLVGLGLLQLSSAKFFILTGPEYKRNNLFYMNQRLRDMYCVSDELGSALNWNGNLGWQETNFVNLNEIDRSKILADDRYVYPASDNITCQMNQNSPCSRYWTRTENWNYVTSSMKPMSPVNDNRWEDFPEEKMLEHFRLISPIPNIGSQSVSIRGSSNAQFAICNENLPRSHCFYIIIGGWKNTRSVIRQCPDGIPEPATSIPTGDCLIVLASVNTTSLSSTEWKNFVIKWDFRTQITISIYDSNQKMLTYTAAKKPKHFPSHVKMDNGEPAYFLFARSTDPMLMKFHRYGYSLTTTTKSKLSSPEMTSPAPNRNICIEMSISLCEKCLMIVDFIDRNGKNKAVATFQNKITNNVYDLPAWRTVKINKTLPIDMQQPIVMSINTLLSNNTNKSNPYWAISNVRRCYDGAIKVVKIKAYQDYDGSNYFWPNVTCQKLSADGTSSIIDSTNHKTTTLKAETRSLCPEGKIGTSCMVTCSKLFWENTDCHKLLMCDQNGCSCAQGFTLPGCDERCPASTYGYECKQKCGNCSRGSCNFATGECKYGCANTDKKLFLPPYCNIGVGSPPAPTIDLINSTCVRVYLEADKDYKIIPTNVSFEIWGNTTTPTYSSDPVPVHKNTAGIETFFERLNPGTRYKVAGIVHAENKTYRGEWINVTTPCTESVALNFVIYSNETSITINNWVDVHVNDSCPYTWYRVQLYSEREKLFNESTPFPKVFHDLESFTQFKVVISSEKTIIVNKLVSTLESAPGPVKNLEVLSISMDEIHFSWEPPIKPRGRLVNYTAEIQPIESLGCSDLDIPSYNSSTNNSQSFEMQIVITNTTRSNFSHTFYGLKPYTRYLVSVYASTAKHQGEKSVFGHATKSTEIPTEIFNDLHLSYETSETMAANLRWSPPSDCMSITGPILASKLYIRKIGRNFTIMETNLHNFPLDKSNFEGDEKYEVILYTLRYFGGTENKTAFISLNFTMPAREPPPVRHIEIIEVDLKNDTITLKWEPPSPPLNGKLDHYFITSCLQNLSKCNVNESTIIYHEDFCKLWKLNNALCATIPLPPAEYDIIQIRAHNANVSEESLPTNIPTVRNELMPFAPTELSSTIKNPNLNQNVSVKLTWSHPLRSGGRLVEFEITAQLLNSSLRIKPWQEKISSLEIDNYKPNYNSELELFPSSTFLISVNGLTSAGLSGEKVEVVVEAPSFVAFNTTDLKAKANEDLTISIQIPKILNDVVSSRLVIGVQGSRFCDEVLTTSDDIYPYFGTQSSTNYPISWMAASLTEPKIYVSEEFRIGDGFTYGNAKNYILCAKESYVIYLILVDDSEDQVTERYEANSKNILEIIKTYPIYVGESPKNYAIWLAPLFLILLIAMLFIIIAFRKKFSEYFLKNKPKTNMPENMPLSNDFNRKNKLDEVESGTKIKDTKDLPYDNLFIVEKKKTYLMPVKVEDFENYFESAYKSGALNKEYMTIKSGPTKPCIYGSQPEVKPKNRYANLFPYDETRVILEKTPDDPHSDYINANFIRGYKGKEKAYIATQGPKPNTVIDFWRMIWQEKVQIICMMANLIENGKMKCEQYWPSTIGKKVLYGTISVQFSSEEVHSDFTYRKFRVTCGNQEPRTVEHLHYTAWPDHGVPSNPRSIVSFLREIQRHAPGPRGPESPPILVHCSAGVGRTGTLVVLDMAVCRALAEQVVDVFANVLSARSDRLNMVDNVEQYLLLHLVLVEYFNKKDAELICDKALPERIREAKKNSLACYQRILDTSWWNEILGSPQLTEKPVSNRNRAKHRFPESAAGINRLYLKRSVITDEDSDYIAGTSVKNIFKNRQYIATQLPMPSTLSDFWRMLSELNVEYVLVLQLPDLQNPTYCELVPESQGFASTKYLKIVRQEDSKTDMQYYLKEESLIIDSSEQPSKNQVVKIISYKHWSDTTLPSPDDLVRLWKVIEDLPKNEKSPIVVACRDGVTASGLWLTLSYMLNRMSADKICDIPLAVRAIRRCRKDFIKQPEHIEYLYDVALAWFDEIFQ